MSYKKAISKQGTLVMEEADKEYQLDSPIEE
jgi:hypothetical protein